MRLVLRPKTKKSGSFRLRPKKKKKRIRIQKAKIYQHDPVIELDDLHEDETYSFFESSRSGYRLKTVEGYQLKHGWDRYEKAFEKRGNSPNGDIKNWITLRLPNKMIMVIQPYSATLVNHE